MRGGMRLVYGFQDEEVAKNGSWMVAKCSRYSNEILNSQLAVEAHAKSTAVARYFAARFNGRLQALGGEKLATLLFVPCFVYKVEGDAPINEPKCFAAERYLPGVFLKYNSNNGYVADALLHNDAVQSFLHFSFEESGGHFIVADLQGVARESEVLLTDPQVLSLTRECFRSLLRLFFPCLSFFCRFCHAITSIVEKPGVCFHGKSHVVYYFQLPGDMM